MATDRLTKEEKIIIKRMRNEGNGYKKIAKILDCELEKVKYYCKTNSLGGCRVEQPLEEREKEFRKRFNKMFPNHIYLSGYKNADSMFKSKCKRCGNIQERSSICARPSRTKGEIKRDKCIEVQLKQRKSQEILEREKAMEEKRQHRIAKREQERKNELTKRCEECGEVFVANTLGAIYCSKQCSDRKQYRTKDIKRRKRLKENGHIEWNITLEKLIKRDNKMCHICGEEININDYQRDVEGNFIVGKTYPSIDHVLPINKGGTHTWDNVKLAHHYCNSIKSDSDIYEDSTNQLTLAL